MASFDSLCFSSTIYLSSETLKPSNLRMTNFIFTVSAHLLILRKSILSFLFSVYSCALLRDILLQGRLYISRNWLCFYANLFGKDIKVWMTDKNLNKLKLTDKPELSNSVKVLTTWQIIWLKVNQDYELTVSPNFPAYENVFLHMSAQYQKTSSPTEPLTLTSYVIFYLMYCESFFFLHFLETKPLLTSEWQ